VESDKIDWSELARDVIHRVSAGEPRSTILNDLYYGIEAEVAYHHLQATEEEMARLATEFLECMVVLCDRGLLARWKRRLVLALPSYLRPMWLLVCRCWLTDMVSQPHPLLQWAPAPA
jgi:hypothetical protein